MKWIMYYILKNILAESCCRNLNSPNEVGKVATTKHLYSVIDQSIPSVYEHRRAACGTNIDVRCRASDWWLSGTRDGLKSLTNQKMSRVRRFSLRLQLAIFIVLAVSTARDTICFFVFLEADFPICLLDTCLEIAWTGGPCPVTFTARAISLGTK